MTPVELSPRSLGAPMTAPADVAPRTAHPQSPASTPRMPAASSEAVLAWLEAAEAETDNPRITAALATVRDHEADALARDLAVSVLVRALRPAILARFAEMRHGRWHQHRFAEITDMLMATVYELVADTKAVEPGQFVFFACRRLRQAGQTEFRRDRSEVGHTVRGHERQIGGPGRSHRPKYLSDAAVEQAFAADVPSASGPMQQDAADAVLVALDSAIVEATPTRPNVREALRHYFGLGEYEGRAIEELQVAAAEHDAPRNRTSEALARVRELLEAAAANVA